MNLITRPLAIFLLLASGAAEAHTGHGTSGLLSGLTHPLDGADHLLAMLAVGLWAAQTGGRRLWLLPATFLATLPLGALAGMLYPFPPLVEPALAASVLVLGLLIAMHSAPALATCIALTATFGLLHGQAHGAEMPGTVAPASYALGFLATTAVLHLLGIELGSAARHTRVTRVLGGSIALGGLWMLVAAGTA